MAKRGGKVHVATTRRHYKGTEYTTTLLRRSYREDGKVKNETLGNLSHLPDTRSMGCGRCSPAGGWSTWTRSFEIVRSLPHGHVAAVLGVLRDLGLERLICRERCRERDLVMAMICQRLLDPCSKLSTTRLVHQTRSPRARARRGDRGGAVTQWNENPRPFIWTKSAEEILAKLARLLTRINGAGH